MMNVFEDQFQDDVEMFVDRLGHLLLVVPSGREKTPLLMDERLSRKPQDTLIVSCDSLITSEAHSFDILKSRLDIMRKESMERPLSRGICENGGNV